MNWDCSNTFKKDEFSFIFSLTKKRVFKTKKQLNYIFCSPLYGPSFGVSDTAGLWNMGKIGGYLCDIYGDNESVCTCGLKDFIIDEMEVYKVSF